MTRRWLSGDQRVNNALRNLHKNRAHLRTFHAAHLARGVGSRYCRGRASVRYRCRRTHPVTCGDVRVPTRLLYVTTCRDRWPAQVLLPARPGTAQVIA